MRRWVPKRDYIPPHTIEGWVPLPLPHGIWAAGSCCQGRLTNTKTTTAQTYPSIIIVKSPPVCLGFMKFYKTTIGQSFLSLAALSVVVKALPLNDTHSPDKRISKRQSDCQWLCADPRDWSYDNPCGNCDHSECMFEGCVHTGAHGSLWKPDACTTCYCRSGKKECFRKTCKPLECYGYPKVKRPRSCCEECDFGTHGGVCNLIPVGWKEISLRSFSWMSILLWWGSRHTCKKIMRHGCEKRFAFSQGNWHVCEPEEGLVNMKTTPGCERISFDLYQYDNVKCTKRIAGPDEIPQDYDPRPYC